MTDSGQPGGSGAGSTVETSEPMPRGVIHDPGCCCWPHIEASAVTQLRADLEAAQSEIERLNVELHNSNEVRDMAIGRLKAGGLDTELAQARARIDEARRDGLRRGTELAVETLEDQLNKFDASSEEHHYLSQIIDGLRVGLSMAIVQALDAAQAAGTSAEET